MIAFFQFLIEVFNLFLSYIINFFGALIDLFAMLISAVAFVVGLPSLVPSIIGSSILIVLVIGIIKLIPYGGSGQ